MATRRTEEANIFSAENIRNCERYVFSMQQRLDRVVATNDVKRIRHIFDLLTKRSQAVKILAVHRITRLNQGKNTAGIDGIAISKESAEDAMKMRLDLLNNIDIKSKPDKIRRVHIPKSNGKKRPLGIPTMKDRINQEIFRIAIEPIVEYYSHNNSYGFRPKRSCHDAIGMLYIKLGRTKTPRYIVEGDIKGCFDNISHNQIINTLGLWKVPSFAINTINGFLKTKVFHNGEIFDNETGTPQGGVISPLLANVSLTSLDTFVADNFGYKHSAGISNPIVRYADDFVIVCHSKQLAKQVKESVEEHLTQIGLTLSKEKTKITHIKDGFDFLGFNIRKYRKTPHKSNDSGDYSLLIKPQKEKILNLLRGCKEIIDSNKTATQLGLIQRLNSKLQGWANYYKFVVSSEVFSGIDQKIWWKVFNWCKRRHPTKTAKWIIRKYYDIYRKNKPFSEKGYRLVHMSNIFSKTRFVIVKNGMRVYSAENADYWRKREYMNTRNKLYSYRVKKLYEKQEGFCPHCKTQITEKDVDDNGIHIHHMLPRSFEGSERYSNLRLLHKECHIELHQILSRKKMNDIVKEHQLDYIKNLKHFISDDLESRVL